MKVSSVTVTCYKFLFQLTELRWHRGIFESRPYYAIFCCVIRAGFFVGFFAERRRARNLVSSFQIFEFFDI